MPIRKNSSINYIVFDTWLGHSERFAGKFGIPTLNIKDADLLTDNDLFIMATRCQNFGEIPTRTEFLLQARGHQCIGSLVNGNKHWGEDFGASAEKMAERYNIPNILIYEWGGTQDDVKYVTRWLEEWESDYARNNKK